MRYLYEFLLFLILGVWLMLSPYVLEFTKQYNPYWNAVAVGAIVTLLSVIGLYADRDKWAGGHRPAHPQHAGWCLDTASTMIGPRLAAACARACGILYIN